MHLYNAFELHIMQDKIAVYIKYLAIGIYDALL